MLELSNFSACGPFGGPFGFQSFFNKPPRRLRRLPFSAGCILLDLF